MLLLQLIGCILALYIGRLLARRILPSSDLDNLPGPKSVSYISGHLGKLFDRHESQPYRRAIEEQYGRTVAIRGLFNTRWLYTFDPRALHSMYTKDQILFEESAIVIANFGLCIGPGLFATLGDQHKRQRKMLNPLFSAKHLREITPVFLDVVHRLEDAVTTIVQDRSQELDIIVWMGRTALELIGQGGLGYSFDPLTRDVTDEFAESIKEYFPAEEQTPIAFRFALPVVVRLGPAWLRRRLTELLPHKSARRMLRISDTLYARSREIVAQKKATLAQGDEVLKHQLGERKDIISVLLRENMAAVEEDMLSDDEVNAQVSTLVLAATDTTSNVLARIFHQLALHTDAQTKLRDELLRARDDGTGQLRDLAYDELMELPYLDAVCRETLRRYPSVASVMRVALRDAVLPLSTPIRGMNGTLIESIPIPKGTQVLIDIAASNCDKELWGEDAYEWNPERWLKPLPRAVEDAPIPGVYSHLMTFIGGARACIGFQLAQLEIKIVLATLIPRFKFESSDKLIVWNSAAVDYPSVGGESTKPELPLRVTRLKPWH